METATRPTVTIQTTIQAPIEKVWSYFNQPEHVVRWNAASPDWHTPVAENDLRTGGKFLYRMEAKDGSFGFDFGGVYDDVQENKLIEFTMGDGRKVRAEFNGNEKETTIVENFEAESENPVEMQKSGWQSILDNFKKYTEAN